MKPNEEFDRLVRGAGQYTADLKPAYALHAVFLRSQYAHARITKIETEEAKSMDGVVAVLTAHDMPELSGIPVVANHPLMANAEINIPVRPCLAKDVVRYVGECVAVVIAKTNAIANEAMEAVFVEYDPLPVVLNSIEAVDAAATAIHPEAPDNIAMSVSFGERDEIEKAIRLADEMVELSIELPRVVPNPMEPRSAYAKYDETANRYSLWAPHQGAPEMIHPLASALNASPADIRIHATDVGGAFGARGPAYPEYAILLAAARIVGSAISWSGTRSESFLSDAHGRGNILKGRLGVDSDGKFQALSVTFEADLGAYVTPVGALINVKNTLPCVTGCYAIQNVAVDIVQKFSNSVPTGPYRGAGRPDVALLIERLVDRAADQLGMEPDRIREQNMIQASDLPWKTPFGSEIDSGDFARLMVEAKQLADWDGFFRRNEESVAQGKLRGIGIALFMEVAGGGAAKEDNVILELHAVDGGVEAKAIVSGHSTGQGHATVFSKMIAEKLGLDEKRVSIESDDGSAGLVGSGSFASRSAVSFGSALHDAIGKAEHAVKSFVKERAETDSSALNLIDGNVELDGHPYTSLDEIIIEMTQRRGSLSFQGTAPVSFSFPSGCHIAEVEIDPSTGEIEIKNYTAVDDCGVILDKQLVEGQLTGAIAQGVGEALGEVVVHDPSGQILTASFMDYFMPRAVDIPPLKLSFHNTPCRNNPLGSKGVGEAGVAGSICAISNSVMDALSNIPSKFELQMPFTAEKIWSAMQDGDDLSQSF